MPPPTVESLQSRYCRTHACTPEKFARQIFWRCLHRRAVPLVWVLGGPNSDYFISDRRMVSAIALATTMSQVRDEVTEFLADPDNDGWWRRRLRIRLSTSRTVSFARRYLPSTSGAPFPSVTPADRAEPAV